MNNGIDLLSYTLGKKAGGGSTPTGTIDITQNGITNVSGYATANVQVPEKQLEEKSVTISSNTTTLIEPSTGKDGMSSVSVTTQVKYAPRYISFIYYEGENLSYELENLDTINMTTMADMFRDSSITELDLSDFNISNVTYMQNMFIGDANLTNVNLSNLIFSNNIEMTASMFENCTKLTELDLSGLVNTSSNFNCSNMFKRCTKLKKINLSNFNSSTIGDCSSMFWGCTSLEELDISSMTMPLSNNANMFSRVPDNCLILVKDQTAKDWFTTNWSNLTNVQIKSEYIANQGA